MKLETLLKKYAALDEKEVEAVKLEDAKKAYADLRKEMLRKGYSQDEITSFTFSLVRLASSIDREADKEEYELFVKATDAKLSQGEFIELVKHGYEKNFVDTMNQIVDSFRTEAKNAALRFVACFLVSDKELTPTEKELFKLLED